MAASHFAGAPQPVASINQPPFAAHGSLAAEPAVINAALQQQQAQTNTAGTTVAVTSPASSNCTTGRYTGEPFGMNFKDLDLKDFFRLIHEISGLNVVLDPSVKGSVTIVLDDVPWDQALAIVLENNGLACTLSGNVLRIATLDTMKTEAEARRAQQDAQALAVPRQTITRYLSYAHAKDAMPVIKKFLSTRGDVISDDRSNALIVEDIPSVLPQIEELIRMLDKKAPEVEIEARVVASTRTFARDIGTNLTPTQWAALSKLAETGPCSQNQLGRLTAMDVATIKGVIDRLTARGLTETSSDPEDGRRLLVSLTRAGQQLAEKIAPNALAISKETLAPLDAKERETLFALLNRLR